MRVIQSQDLHDALRRIAAHMQTVSAELCAADGALGDGDLGITVAKGFAEASAQPLVEDLGQAFLMMAKAFQRVSSSSYGTLVATAFMSAAKSLKGKTEITACDLGALLEGARDAMMARGKGALGDKTVLDVVDCVARLSQTSPLADFSPALLEEFISAAATTVETFKAQPNKLGRARMFGERSRGLVDPGQLAFLRILESLRP